MRSISVGPSPSGPRRNTKYPDQLQKTQFPNVNTIYDLFKRSCSLYKPLKCMGSREFLHWEDVGENFPVKVFGETKWRNYGEVEERSLLIGAGLRALKLQPQPQISENEQLDPTNNSCIAIYENTCADWMCACLGALSQSLVVATVYATLGVDAVQCAINEASISVLFCNRSHVQMILDNRAKMPSLTAIVYINDIVEPSKHNESPVSNIPEGFTVISIDHLIEIGEKSSETYPPEPPIASQFAVIMYTSGSTGKPKGVLLRHSHFIASISHLSSQINLREGQESLIGYLPLAHIFELGAEICTLGIGGRIGYADPKTLTTSGCRPIGSLELFQPTLMAGVPKIWDIFAKAIKGKIAKASPLVQFLFNLAFKTRSIALKQGRDTPLFNLLIFRKFKKIIGGRLSKGITGGGALSAEAQEFITVCFGFPLIQGYGLTEVCGAATCQTLDDLRCGVTGAPSPSLEIKLISCLEENGEPSILDKHGFPYLSTDTKDSNGNPCLGRGEILIRGNNVCSGYFQMPEKTSEAFDNEGWFHSGDVGQWLSDGSLRIVDRIKNLIKLKGGEYIAIENMETIFGNCPYVDAIAGGVMVYGDSDMDRPIAFVQVSVPIIKQWADENGIESKTNEELISTPQVNKLILDSLNAVGKKSGLGVNEKIAAVELLCDPWTVDNGCLTGTNKLSRRNVQSLYAEQLERVKRLGIR